MKLLKIHILKKQGHFQQHFKTNVEIIQMNLRAYQIKSNQLPKKWIWGNGCMYKWL